MLLADMGAEVIKIEPPWGDASRSSPQYPKVGDQNAYFMHVNRNKKSVVLDLKSEKGVEVFKKLVKGSDVVVENFRPGVMDRLNIGYDILSEINPGIIYASISGFGQKGPYVKRPSFDIIAQALSGWMWLNSRETRGLNSKASLVPSCLSGSPGDTIPGLFCALSILAALNYRNMNEQGQKIDIAQTDSLITISGLGIIRTLYTDSNADERAGEPSTHIHGVYKAKDGFITIRVIGERSINSVAETLGIKPEDVTPSSAYFIDWFKKRTRSEVAELLADKVPCAPVLTDEELLKDPNVVAREMFNERAHPSGFKYHTIETGIKFSKTPVAFKSPPPLLGANTLDILDELGYSSEDIKNLIDEGAVA
jgi:crotonobetainyl-CoA:carnitine CoA-transferase CaiB-like acyl-CoA transferase